MARQTMYLFYLLPFLLINPVYTWFGIETKDPNPTVDCINLFKS